MESWRLVWRNGFASLFPTDGLAALAKALYDDDPNLIQGSTTTPPPLMCVQDWPVEAADAISFVGWKSGSGLKTVEQVSEYFARSCYDCDDKLGVVAMCRFFLNFWDDTPRDRARRELYDEVRLTLESRNTAPAFPALPAPVRPEPIRAPF